MMMINKQIFQFLHHNLGQLSNIVIFIHFQEFGALFITYLIWKDPKLLTKPVLQSRLGWLEQRESVHRAIHFSKQNVLHTYGFYTMDTQAWP